MAKPERGTIRGGGKDFPQRGRRSLNPRFDSCKKKISKRGELPALVEKTRRRRKKKRNRFSNIGRRWPPVVIKLTDYTLTHPCTRKGGGGALKGNDHSRWGPKKTKGPYEFKRQEKGRIPSDGWPHKGFRVGGGRGKGF